MKEITLVSIIKEYPFYSTLYVDTENIVKIR